MRVHLSIIFSLLCSTAFAVPVASFAKPVADTPPVAIETSHLCMLPSAGNFAIWPTRASFTVAEDGSVKDVQIVEKSNVPALDDVAKICVSAWRYRPATHQGKPVAKVWQDAIHWSAPSGAINPITVTNKPPSGLQQPAHQAATPVSVGRPHTCNDYYPPDAEKAHSEGRALVGFTVTALGTVKDVIIKGTTGDVDLDAASVTCVSQWLYKPAMKDGVPVDVPWLANVVWKTNLPLMPAAPFKPCKEFTNATAEVLKGISGSSWIAFQIMQDGSVKPTRIISSSGNDDLDRAATRCIGARRYDVSDRKLPSEGMSQSYVIDWRGQLSSSTAPK